MLDNTIIAYSHDNGGRVARVDFLMPVIVGPLPPIQCFGKWFTKNVN